MNNLLICTACGESENNRKNIEKCQKLYESARMFNIPLKTFYSNKDYSGLTNLKVIDFYGFLRETKEEYIIYLDAFDTLFMNDCSDIVDKFLSADCEMWFNHETNCEPKFMLPFYYNFDNKTEDKTLNAGLWMAKTKDAIKFYEYILDLYNKYVQHTINGHTFDQTFWHYAYLSKRFNIKLDTDCLFSAVVAPCCNYELHNAIKTGTNMFGTDEEITEKFKPYKEKNTNIAHFPGERYDVQWRLLEYMKSLR